MDDNLKIIIFTSVTLFFLLGCNTNENDFSEILPLGADKIESIEINSNQVTVTTIYGTPTTCWYYYRTERTNNDIVVTLKVFGKYDGEPCIQMLGSCIHKEKINFLSKGNKTLKFWQNDSSYLDTTITLQ